MFRSAIFAAAATAMFATPALADNWGAASAQCASALEANGTVAAGEYSSKFIAGRGASVKQVTVKIMPKDGSKSFTAKCKIKRGEIIDVVVNQ